MAALAHHLTPQQQEAAAAAVPDGRLQGLRALFNYIQRHHGLTVTPAQRYYLPLNASLAAPRRTNTQWVQWLKAKVGVT